MRNEMTRRPSRTCLLAIASLLVGCAMAPADDTEIAAAESGHDDLGTVEEALTGRGSYTGCGEPLAAAFHDRTLFYARTLAQSDALEDCVRNSISAYYIRCLADPVSGSDALVANAAMTTLRDSTNPITLHCQPSGGASAHYQGYGSSDEHFINNGPSWTPDGNWDWGSYGDGILQAEGEVAGDDGYEPWNWFASTWLHEFMHTHDWSHPAPDQSCATDGSDCSDTDCQWTTFCGGSGVPPSGWNDPGDAGRSAAQWCAYEETGQDNWLLDGDPSIPYIVGSCAAAIIQRSHHQCGKATDSAACGEESLRVVSSWTGTHSTAQPSSACECVADPTREVWLRADNGRRWMANGGHGSVSLNSSLGGAWQTFYMIDADGGDALEHADRVYLQTREGSYVGPNGLWQWSPLELRIWNASGGADIGRASRVRLGLYGFGGWSFADGQTGTLGQTSSFSAADAYTIESPSRRQRVYLESVHGFLIAYDTGSRYVYNFGAGAWIDSSSNTFYRRHAAMVMIDHNGEYLRDGDIVSLETGFDNDDAHYISTVAGTGQVRSVNYVGDSERFVMNIVGRGSLSRLQHGDRITLRAVNKSTWLTATPGGSPHYTKLLNGGTWEGAWQELTVHYVDQRDRPRPYW